MAAEISKPDFSYQWSSGGAIVAPSNVKIQTGWTAEVPPFQWENYLQNRQDNAILHLFQKGISEWDAASNYYFTTSGVRSYVQGSDGIIYVAVQDSIGQNPTTDLTDTYWKVAFADNSTALTTTTGDARYARRTNNLSDLSSIPTAQTNLGVMDSIHAGISGNYLNLKSSTVGTNAVAVLTADQFCVKDATGLQKVLTSVNISVNGAVSGLNGLDTASLTVNTWYYLHVIYNPTTLAVGGIISLSSVLPSVLPSGFTYSAYASTSLRVGATNTRFLPMSNEDGKVFWRPAAGTDMASDFPLVLNNGTSTGATAISLQAVAPPSAKTAKIGVTVTGTVSARGEVFLGSGTVSGMLSQTITNGTATMRQQVDTPAPFANGIFYAIANPGAITIAAMGYEE